MKVIKTWLNCILAFCYPRHSYLVQEALVLYFFCWGFMFSTQEMHWTVHSLADTPPPFSTIWQFFSEMSNNWGIGLPYLCPSWIYCTGQQCIVFCFQVSFSVFPSCVHHSCAMDNTYHSHKSSVHLHLDHHVTLPFECRLPFLQVFAFLL